MNLFDKEKDLIHRIANCIFVIWLVGAIFLFYNNMINLLFKSPTLTYEEYELQYCRDLLYEEEKKEIDKDKCNNMYQQYLLSNKNNDYYAKRNLLYTAGNMVIVGTSLYLLNRNKKKK